MHISVSNETRHNGQNGDDHDRGCTWDSSLIAFAHRSESQSAGDAIDRTPSDTGDRVQDNWEAVWEEEGEREPGKRQLAEAELWAECREVGDGDGREKVEEDDGEDCGSEFEIEYGGTKGSEREGRRCGIGGKPHPHTVGQVLSVIPLIGEDSFDPTGFDPV